MSNEIQRFLTIFFQGVTVEGAAVWLRSLIASVWGALGGVVLNGAMQWASGNPISRAELFRAALGVSIPVFAAYLWKSPMQHGYIAPRNLPDEKPK